TIDRTGKEGLGKELVHRLARHAVLLRHRVGLGHRLDRPGDQEVPGELHDARRSGVFAELEDLIPEGIDYRASRVPGPLGAGDADAKLASVGGLPPTEDRSAEVVLTTLGMPCSEVTRGGGRDGAARDVDSSLAELAEEAIGPRRYLPQHPVVSDHRDDHPARCRHVA